MVQDFQISERVKLSWSDTAELVGSSSVDEVGLRERVASLATRSIKRDSKLQALNMIVSMCDLTTLEGQDTDGKVSQMVAKAIRPDPNDSSVPSVAAVCVYPGLVETAKKETSGSEVLVASVSSYFPSGQAPLESKIHDTKYAISNGADEIDIVINRKAFLEGNYRRVFDEISALSGRARYFRQHTKGKHDCYVSWFRLYKDIYWKNKCRSIKRGMLYYGQSSIRL